MRAAGGGTLFVFLTACGVGDNGDMNYATLNDAKADLPDDLVTGVDDTTLGRLVSHASRVVGRATRRAVYNTDNEGMPRSETLRTVFRDATVAQTRSWLEAGLVDEVFTGGVTMQASVSSSSSNGKSITFDNTASDAARAHLVGGGLGAEAELILESVGLLGGMPGVLR